MSWVLLNCISTVGKCCILKFSGLPLMICKPVEAFKDLKKKKSPWNSQLHKNTTFTLNENVGIPKHHITQTSLLKSFQITGGSHQTAVTQWMPFQTFLNQKYMLLWIDTGNLSQEKDAFKEDTGYWIWNASPSFSSGQLWKDVFARTTLGITLDKCSGAYIRPQILHWHCSRITPSSSSVLGGSVLLLRWLNS